MCALVVHFGRAFHMYTMGVYSNVFYVYSDVFRRLNMCDYVYF